MFAGWLSRERHVIVCTKCGFSNLATDSFCGSCGSFLEWTGSKLAEPAPEPVAQPAAPEPQPAEPEHQTFVGRVREVVGLGGGSASAGEAGAESAGGAAAPGAPRVVDSGSAAAAAAAAEAERAGSAASTPVVVSGTRIYRMAITTGVLLMKPSIKQMKHWPISIR